jgi:hydroxymethylbilane synthase
VPVPSLLRLATRGSPLARWQADRVAVLLRRRGVDVELVVVETQGDRRTDVPLAALGGQGVFVKEVQRAVVRGDADVAVHSAKDLPAAPELPAPGLVLVALPARGDPRDCLVGGRLGELPSGSLVATGSARRRVQLANRRPDLTFTDLRGNLATRLARVGRDGVTAVVVAAAALDRLGWKPPAGTPVETFAVDDVVPQVGQGALALECRDDDTAVRDALAPLDDAPTRRRVVTERAFLAALGGGCTLPVGAHAVLAGTDVVLTGLVAAEDGRVVLRHTATGGDPDALGRSVARYLLDDAGARAFGPWDARDDDAGSPATMP